MNPTQPNNYARFAATIYKEIRQLAVTASRTVFRVLLMDQRTIVLMEYTTEEFEGRYKTETVMILRDKNTIRKTEGVNIYDSPIVLPEIVDKFLCKCDLMRKPELVGLKTHQEKNGERMWFVIKNEGKPYLSEYPIEFGTEW